MGEIVINPGTEPLANTTAEHARLNVERFCHDLAVLHDIHVAEAAPNGAPEDGLYPWVLGTTDGRRIEIDMPGLPLDKVRYMPERGEKHHGAGLGKPLDQNPWDFPRMYVDGSSWLWEFGLRVCRPEDAQ